MKDTNMNTTSNIASGPYRKVSRKEYDELTKAGVIGEIVEGTGPIVYDEQAREDFKGSIAEIEMRVALSEDALMMWVGFFRSPGSTLRFGGDHADMEITEEGRAALNELLEVGAAQPTDPDDQWPGREHYASCGLDLSQEFISRDLDPFSPSKVSTVFRKKPSAKERPNGLDNVSIRFG